jgi:hypothetical protein
MIRKRWLTLFLILIMGGAVFAGGLTYKAQVKTHAGANAPANYAVECWEGAITTGPTGPNYITGGQSKSPQPPNPVTTRSDGKLCPQGDPSTDGFYDPRYSKSVRVRVWEGSNPSDVINAKGYYGYGNYSIGGVTAPPAEKSETITTNYKADAPDVPTVTAGGYNLTWDNTAEQYLVAFTLTAHAGTAWPSEGVSYTIRVRKPTDTYVNERTNPGASYPIIENDMNNPYFVGGGTYVAQATASNAFGSTDGPEYQFIIPTGGGGGTAGPVTYYLRKAADGAIGLNAVSVVHEVSFHIGADTITSVGNLAAAINTVAGANVVTAVGTMVTGQMEGVYITYDSNGVATYTPTAGFTGGESTALVRGQSWQISVSEDVDVTFSQ